MYNIVAVLFNQLVLKIRLMNQNDQLIGVEVDLANFGNSRKNYYFILIPFLYSKPILE